ncbi:MAG: tail fiber domain-containing protein [Planctomycetes bacterium]|nr:tail fiber domain-containing protein [Planctomycetota bacterium]
MKMYSARAAACAALIVAAFVPGALGQVVYNSQSRTISAQGEGSGDGNRTLTAPDFGPWNQTVVSHGSVGTGRATQVSSLQPWGASLNISTEVLGVASASGSCYFDFTPNEPLLVRISGSGEGFGTGFSLIGAGVSLSYTAHPDGSSWDVSALLQAGQKYSFTSGGSGGGTSPPVNLNLTLAFSPAPVAQSRGFSFQGVVRDASGQPISTPTDMEFRLFHHPTSDLVQVGPTIAASEVPVDKGVFTRELDFGDVFKGEARWLEVRVRNPAGNGAFTTILPRTLITTAPYASYALRATSATQAIEAQVAAYATSAGSATTAANATAAASAPWSGLTGQGGVTSAAVGTGWQFLLNNNSVPGFRGGLRLADSGFLEITNSAQLASPNFARLSSSGAWSAVSDARLKTDVTGVDGQLAAALKLRPVKFRWKFDGREDMGLIAQEVREVFPTLVSGDEVEGILSVNYSQLSVVAIGAIQELKTENDRKQREIDDLKARLERIEARLK